MFIKNYIILFGTFLIFGTILSISSNSWFLVWLGLEINLMSMIPIMINKMNQSMTEASIKYFITQAMASVILIFSTMINMFMNNIITIESINILLIISLLMKSGMAPFHLWFPQVIMNMNWIQSLILFTWQKIAPLILMSSFLNNLTIFASLLSAVVGAISGLNQTFLKPLLTFSSITHSGWMIMACMMNFKLWFIYFSIYTFLILTLIYSMWNKFNKINEMNYSNQPTYYKIYLISMILSLGGMPPLIGFLSKMLVINKLMFYLMMVSITVLVGSSLLSLYWYLRLVYSSLSFENNFFKNSINNSKLNSSLFIWMAATLNILSPLIMISLT